MGQGFSESQSSRRSGDTALYSAFKSETSTTLDTLNDWQSFQNSFDRPLGPLTPLDPLNPWVTPYSSPGR